MATTVAVTVISLTYETGSDVTEGTGTGVTPLPGGSTMYVGSGSVGSCGGVRGAAGIVSVGREVSSAVSTAEAVGV